VLTNIHHDQVTMDDIRNSLNAGMEVITHTDAVSVPGWSGAGYIITNQATGDAAYKISGGGNGAILGLAAGFGVFLLAIITGEVSVLLLQALLIAIIVAVIPATILALASSDPLIFECFLLVPLLGIDVALIIGTKLTAKGRGNFLLLLAFINLIIFSYVSPSKPDRCA